MGLYLSAPQQCVIRQNCNQEAPPCQSGWIDGNSMDQRSYFPEILACSRTNYEINHEILPRQNSYEMELVFFAKNTLEEERERPCGNANCHYH
jgi:hypothetical protein